MVSLKRGFVFKKANSRTATQAHKHQSGLVDDEKKQSEKQVPEGNEKCMAGPPLKSRLLRRKNTKQSAG
jgi:hypothetical protein